MLKIKQILTHFYIKYTINPQINTKKRREKNAINLLFKYNCY